MILVTDLTLQYHYMTLCVFGWERNFVPKIFRGIDSERFPLFRGRKSSFRGIPSSAEEPVPKLGTERNHAEKISFTKQPK